jgi:hypothetical protein
LEANATQVWFTKCDDSLNKTQQWDADYSTIQTKEEKPICLSAPSGNPSVENVLAEPCEEWSRDKHKFTMWIVTPVDAALQVPAPNLKNSSSSGSFSLYCVAIMLPWGYSESALIRTQCASKWSIFSCDAYDVYSSIIADLGCGLTTKMVYSHLHVGWAKSKTVANTPVFQHFWSQLISDGRYLAYNWTIKADPDTVFLPSRLYDLIRWDKYIVDKGAGILFNTCGNDLHGPIEVISRLALKSYGDNAYNDCYYVPQEDLYLHDCLQRLGTRTIYKYNLLAEAHCGWGYVSPNDCDVPRVSYHPFKWPASYQKCMEVALAAEKQWPGT